MTYFIHYILPSKYFRVFGTKSKTHHIFGRNIPVNFSKSPPPLEACVHGRPHPSRPPKCGWLTTCAYLHANTSNPLLSRM